MYFGRIKEEFNTFKKGENCVRYGEKSTRLQAVAHALFCVPQRGQVIKVRLFLFLN